MFPIHLNLGFNVMHFYEGAYFALSILLGVVLTHLALKKAGLKTDLLANSVFMILIGALVGARLFHFLFWDVSVLVSDPLIFFNFAGGGFSITGGLAGGMLAGYLYFRAKRVNFWQYFAYASPAILVAQAAGRVGCFLNGDAWGIPTDLPWGLHYPRYGTLIPNFTTDTSASSLAWSWASKMGLVAPDSTVTVPLHPTQLYESLGDLALAGLIFWLLQQIKKTGQGWQRIFLLHVGGYSLLRFGLEFLHGDKDVVVWASMTSLQIVLLLTGLVCAGWLFKPTKKI